MTYECSSDKKLGSKELDSEEISVEVWNSIVAVYNEFQPALAECFPERCEESGEVYMCDTSLLEDAIRAEIPKLTVPIKRAIKIEFPEYFDFEFDALPDVKPDGLPDTGAILDFLEFLHKNIREPIRESYHDYYNHPHYSFRDNEVFKDKFRESINSKFRNNRMAFYLDKNGKIQRRGALPKTSPQKTVLQTTENNKMPKPHIDKTKVFIVHGRDDLAKIEVARFVEKFGLEAVILHEQANGGKTIIEKIEEHTNVGYGIVLYTPCDIGGLNETELQPRARQNVVFEHGYLIGKLGRKNVCALVKGNIETPNDISGVVYISLDEHEGWHKKLVKELRAADYEIDADKLFK